MRGTQIFSKLFEEQKQQATNTKSRGRSKEKHLRRNECLADRYFFYGQQKIRYRDILQMLSAEFFISVVTVSEIMDKIYPYLTELKKQPPTTKQLGTKWPHLNWKSE